ncbi:hypothetical protein [Paenisporosarcina sp.]|uniref:hypothetical protein n=1 Tax=Paenisporosarcina sp. TaxID=1932001 RepID=UPI003C78092A
MKNDFNKSNKLTRILTVFMVGFILLVTIFHIIKLPVHMADWLVPFKVVEPFYDVEDLDKQYSKVMGYNKVKLVYENQEGILTVWATSEIGWNKVSNWEEEVELLNGATGYYNETNLFQSISFRVDEVEYSIDYKGNDPISKSDLIKIANSIVITKFA